MKKLNKILSLTATAALALSLTACSGGTQGSAETPAGNSGSPSASGDGYKIAVVRQLDHASMNEIRNAITAELDAKAAELGITITYKDFNGNNDPSTPVSYTHLDVYKRQA